jgi:transcriptional regulator of arginine metabolism
MQTGTEPRDARRRRILTLLDKQRVRSQAELQELLAAAGFPVNQATLSRDLRDLGVVKSKDGYERPEAATQAAASNQFAQELDAAVRTWLVAAEAAQNLVVLRTPAGGAQPLGLALDRAPPAGVLGTIAGDDTVLVICKDAARARGVVRRLAPAPAQRSRA